MKFKKLLVMGMSAMMLANMSVSSYAASLGTVYLGGDTWQRVTLPLDGTINYANIARISFNTKDGARPSYVTNSHSITLNNLYHQGVDGKEVITITMEDGSEVTRELVYGAGGIKALGADSDGVTTQNGLKKGNSGQNTLCKLTKDSDTTLSEIYVDDVLLPRSAWTQSDSEVTISQQYLQGVMEGTHTFYLSAAQGDMYTVEREVLLSGMDNYPRMVTQAVVTQKGSGQNVSISYNAGKREAAGQYNKGIDSVTVGAVTLDAADYTENADAFILKASGVEKLADGANQITIAYTTSSLMPNYTVRGCVVVKPAMDPAPELQPSKAEYEKLHPSEVAFTLTANSHTVTGIKVNGAAVDASVFTINGTSVKVSDEWLQSLKEGTYKLSLQTDGGKDFPSSTIVVTQGTPDKDPSATPNAFEFNKKELANMVMQLDMSVYSFKAVKVGDTVVDTATFDNGVLTIPKEALEALELGDYDIKVVTTADDEYKVATVKIYMEYPKFVSGPTDWTTGFVHKVAYELVENDVKVVDLVIDDTAVGAALSEGANGNVIAMIPASVMGDLEGGEHTLAIKGEDGNKYNEVKLVVEDFDKTGYDLTMAQVDITFVIDSKEYIELAESNKFTGFEGVAADEDGHYYSLTSTTTSTEPTNLINPTGVTPGMVWRLFIYNDDNKTASSTFEIKFEEGTGTPVAPEKHPVSPDKVTYDKREKGDVEFTCDTAVKSYVISGTINDKEVLRTGTCTSAVLPEAVLQGLENGIYKVKFMGTDDIETVEITLVITKSGAQDSSSSKDNENWSYPGKPLPNRRNALGGGQTSGGSSGGGSSSKGNSSSGPSAGSSTVTYPVIDINTLTLLTTTHAGWEQQSDGRWKFKDVTGQYRANTYLATQSGYYVIGADGYMVTGWIQNSQGQWIYTDPVNGNIVDGWHLINGKHYYMAKQDDATHTWGIMYANETTPDGYKVDASGAWIQ